MSVSTSEITSTSLPADNPVHQRLLFSYVKACDYVSGDVLEIGCGQGRGIELLMSKCRSYSAIDKNQHVIDELKRKYPAARLTCASVPGFSGAGDNAYDCLVTFHVIEHIQNDRLFVDEVYRVLKPGGIAIISSPNLKMSLARNPWHIREYTKETLKALLSRKFTDITMMGIFGKERMNRYHEQNRESVRKIMRFDIFNLQYALPNAVLKIPYDILNRINRNKLKDQNNGLVTEITTDDFELRLAADNCFDLYFIVTKT